MYAWPAIWQGADVVGVSDRGKTTSYLLPLSSMLKTKEIYSGLPKYGTGVRFDVCYYSLMWALRLSELALSISNPEAVKGDNL